MNIQRIRIFDEMLDECYPVWKFGEQTFYPSQILGDCDPVAYELASSEYLDNLHQDGELPWCAGCNYPISKEEEYELAIYPHDGEPVHAKCGTE